ncbi:MAG: class I SAM-dependent methyltransferase [Gammaproteobacteria bacterium]|nr:class I SAM-dependent methyltransferase [Gammaproteobacteria bacterium]
MNNIYTSGEYLETTQTWHVEDSPWKSEQILKIMIKNGLHPNTVVEVGCGAGQILTELAKQTCLSEVHFSGYDISPQAIEISKKNVGNNINFICQDFISDENIKDIDLLLAIDVFEHIQDYIGFISICKNKANYKIYHIPLDIHVSAVLRNSFLRSRYSKGHLHYFTADSAIATLKDTGHEIIDAIYTNASFWSFKQNPSIKKAIANSVRWGMSKISIPLAARILGGYSLLVIAR